MKKLKGLGLFIAISLFTIAQAKATVGPNTVVIWPINVCCGPNTVVIWPLIQKYAQANSTLMGTTGFEADYSKSGNVSTITITNGGSFHYTVNQDNIAANVDYSDWPLGNYTGTVTFSNGDNNPISFTISH